MTSSKAATVRRSVVAGSWYPGTESSLRRALAEYFSRVDQHAVPGQLWGLISPHAGYAYSGQTAAHAYAQLQAGPATTVIVLAPSHRAWFDNFAVNTEEAYETPLGRVPLDHQFIDDLARRAPLQRIRGDSEHSLEIQLPFLQYQLGEFKLVPVLVSVDDPAAAQRLAEALVETARQRPKEVGRTLLVASSDMHHIEDYAEVVRRDKAVVEAIAAYDLELLTRLLMDRRCSVCGRMPILTVLHACRLMGADTVQILHHTNSGDVTGERRLGQYTVGYLAAAIYKSQ